MKELGDPSRLERLNRQVTRMMQELEDLVPEAERATRFVQIREAIGNAIGIGSVPR